MRALESYRGKDFVGVEELSNVAAEIVNRYIEEPDRGNVRLAITQRIIRHYLAEDLLGDPSGQTGTSIVFNYGNLLRLLAVKKLLVDGWSVIKIREFMAALDITALEQLINSAFSRTPINQQKKREGSTRPGSAQRVRESRNRASDSNPIRIPVFATRTPNTKGRPLTSLVIESARRAELRAMEWIEIAPGLEIRVRRSFRPPRSEQERERMLKRFLAVIDRDE